MPAWRAVGLAESVFRSRVGSASPGLQVDRAMTLKAIWPLFKKTVGDWNDDNAQTQAAALAYYTVFSIAPLLVIALAVAGFAFGEKAAQGQISGQLTHLLGPAGAQTVEAMIVSANKPAVGIIAHVVGIGALLLGASGVFIQLSQSLNLIWKVAVPKTGSLWRFIKGRLLSFGMVLTIGFLLLVSLVLSTVIAAVGAKLEAKWPGAEALLHLGSSAVSFVIISGLFALIYKVLPETHVAWRDVWLGAVVTSFLFTVGKLLIGLYLGKSGVSSTYGAAASLGIVLLWVYYSSQLLLLGAEFTHVHAQWRQQQRPRAQVQSGPIPASTWLPRPSAV